MTNDLLVLIRVQPVYGKRVLTVLALISGVFMVKVLLSATLYV